MLIEIYKILLQIQYYNDTTGGMNFHNNPVVIHNYLKVCSKNDARRNTQGGNIYIPGETPRRGLHDYITLKV